MAAQIEQFKAELMVPKSARHGGKTFPVRGTLRGHEGEWFRVEMRGRDHYRIVKIGADGRSEATSYRVRADDFIETSREVEAPEAATQNVSLVGQRGAVILAVRLRNRLGIHEGTVVIQEERDGGIWVRPAQVSPRNTEPVSERQTQPILAELLAGITPENLHEEFDFGSPVGAEIL